MAVQIRSTAIGLPVGASVFTRKLKAATALSADLEAYAREIQSNLRTYPPQQFGKPAQWKSERQRRFVLAAIRRGQIVVPRPRRRILAAGWQVTPVGTVRGSYQVQVRNAVPYAAIVHGRRIHEPGSRDMVERQWRNWEAVAIGLLNKYAGRMKARLQYA